MLTALAATLMPWAFVVTPRLIRTAANGGPSIAVSVLYVTLITPMLVVAMDTQRAHTRNSGNPVGMGLRISQFQTATLMILAICAASVMLMRLDKPISRWVLTTIAFASLPVISSAIAGTFDPVQLLFPPLVYGVSTCNGTSVTIIIKHARWLTRFGVTSSLLLYVTRTNDAVMQVSEPDRYLGVPQMAGLTQHPNGMGFIASLALLVELYSPKSRNRPVFITSAMIVLMLTQSRSGWMIGVAVLGIWSYDRLGRGRTITIWSVGLLVTWIALGEFLSQWTLTGREKVWVVAIETFKDSPLIGGGPDALQRVVEGTTLAFGAQAHNQILDSLAKTGLLGAIALVSFEIFAFRRARHLRFISDTSVAVAILAAFTIRGAFESPFKSSFPTYLVIAILSAATASRTKVIRQVPHDRYGMMQNEIDNQS